jgi:hypothetical protein
VAKVKRDVEEVAAGIRSESPRPYPVEVPPELSGRVGTLNCKHRISQKLADGVNDIVHPGA